MLTGWIAILATRHADASGVAQQRGNAVNRGKTRCGNDRRLLRWRLAYGRLPGRWLHNRQHPPRWTGRSSCVRPKRSSAGRSRSARRRSPARARMPSGLMRAVLCCPRRNCALRSPVYVCPVLGRMERVLGGFGNPCAGMKAVASGARVSMSFAAARWTSWLHGAW